VVVLPASMWAMMPIFRTRSNGYRLMIIAIGYQLSAISRVTADS
jgi:hypothetical protein